MIVEWSVLARQDLHAIFDYILEDNPIAALGVLEAIEAAVSSLSNHPGMGRLGRVEATRELVISGLPYIVAYEIRRGRVIILRVLHSARQWPDNL